MTDPYFSWRRVQSFVRSRRRAFGFPYVLASFSPIDRCVERNVKANRACRPEPFSKHALRVDRFHAYRAWPSPGANQFDHCGWLNRRQHRAEVDIATPANPCRSSGFYGFNLFMSSHPFIVIATWFRDRIIMERRKIVVYCGSNLVDFQKLTPFCFVEGGR
jgi:hypothetical protein